MISFTIDIIFKWPKTELKWLHVKIIMSGNFEFDNIKMGK